MHVFSLFHTEEDNPHSRLEGKIKLMKELRRSFFTQQYRSGRSIYNSHGDMGIRSSSRSSKIDCEMHHKYWLINEDHAYFVLTGSIFRYLLPSQIQRFQNYCSLFLENEFWDLLCDRCGQAKCFCPNCSKLAHCRCTRQLQLSHCDCTCNVPSPIRLHHSGCSILEQITGWDSQRILGEIFQGIPRCPLAVTVPWSTHLTHLLPQPIPSAHIDPRKNSHPNDPSHIPTPPPGRF